MVQTHKYRTNMYNNTWDLVLSITTYFTQINCFQISLVDHSITTSNEEKLMAVGAKRVASKMFSEEQVLAWEDIPPTDQTWTNLQMYFTKKWLEHRQYSSTMAKKQKKQKGKCRPCNLNCYKSSTTGRLR
jgi:hypothetical protein